jgi:hypothetical protein
VLVCVIDMPLCPAKKNPLMVEFKQPLQMLSQVSDHLISDLVPAYASSVVWRFNEFQGREQQRFNSVTKASAIRKRV